MTVGKHLELVVCAAPLAQHVVRVGRDIQAEGWAVSVVTSTNAADWVDRDGVQELTGQQAVTRARSAAEPRTRPTPDAVVVLPATFNTLNKLRQGISDTPALGVLNDAVGMRLPLLAVPMVSERLTGHPAWSETVRWLDTIGIVIVDPSTGEVGHCEPLASGTGDTVAERFETKSLIGWLHTLD